MDIAGSVFSSERQKNCNRRHGAPGVGGVFNLAHGARAEAWEGGRRPFWYINTGIGKGMANHSVAATLGQIPDDEAWHRTIILPRDILDNPPSGEHDVDWETESSHRIWGCELLQEAGVLLRLPQVVMCTAQNLLQRFFYRKPLTKFDAFSVAMGCMLLAMKIEEDPRQPRAVVLVFHRMFERRVGVEPSSVIPPESLRVLRDEMLRVELHVLKELGFGFYNIMDHPHKFILYYLRVLELDIEGDVSQHAWNYLNDSLRTDLSLRFRSEVIACAAIYMASRSLGIKLPDNPPWWVLFNADMHEMGEICNTILALYHRPKAAFLEPLNNKSVFRRGGPLRKEAAVEPVAEPAVEMYAPAEEEPVPAAPTAPSTQDSGKSSAVATTAGNPIANATASPAAPSPAPDSSTTVPESNGASEPSTSKVPERVSQSRSRSPGSRSAQSERSHSTIRSAPGVEREDEGADHQGHGRPPEKVHDRERDRKRPRESRRSRGDSRERARDSYRRSATRESRRSRSRSRSRSRRDRRGDSRERGRGRDREKERGERRHETSRRSRR